MWSFKCKVIGNSLFVSQQSLHSVVFRKCKQTKCQVCSNLRFWKYTYQIMVFGSGISREWSLTLETWQFFTSSTALLDSKRGDVVSFPKEKYKGDLRWFFLFCGRFLVQTTKYFHTNSFFQLSALGKLKYNHRIKF